MSEDKKFEVYDLLDDYKKRVGNKNGSEIQFLRDNPTVRAQIFEDLNKLMVYFPK